MIVLFAVGIAFPMWLTAGWMLFVAPSRVRREYESGNGQADA